MTATTKHLPVTIVKAAKAGYDATFILSASSPDRVADTIDPAAYEPNLGKKLIALWQHDTERPLGFWDNLRVQGGQLIADLKISSTNLGAMVRQLLADTVPLGASIGFRGYGEPNDWGGYLFKELELLECSIVSVPAHPLATQISKALEGLSPVSPQSLAGATPATSGHDPKDVIKRAKAATLAANRTLRTKRP